MNKKVEIFFLSENNDQKRCLYASCKLISYIEDLAEKCKEIAKISVTENNIIKKDNHLGYKTVTMIYFNNPSTEQKVVTYLKELLNNIQKQYANIIIEVN